MFAYNIQTKIHIALSESKSGGNNFSSSVQFCEFEFAANEWSFSRGRCMRSSKQIGAETFVKNNGERIVEKWNRGWGIDVWIIGLSEHTKEEEEEEEWFNLLVVVAFG